MKIKNIVFDIGNVLLKWDPHAITKNFFPDAQDHDTLAKELFKSQPWIDLNLGKITEDELVDIYHKSHSIPKLKLIDLIKEVKKSLVPLPGSFELLDSLHKANYTLYCITDNVKEIMTHIKKEYNIWHYFTGIVVSAEICILKPDIKIFNYLLKTYNLKADECLFIDDILKNVEGARNAGMNAIHFTDLIQCKKDLKNLDINF